MTFKERLNIWREAYKSIKDNLHIGRIEGPISPAVTKSIKAAIKGRYLLTIFYKGEKSIAPGWRLIQPYAYGLVRGTNNHVLRAYQISGPSFSEEVPYWRLFRLDRIFNIAANTKKVVNTPVYGFNPLGDMGMSLVLLLIKFPKSKLKPKSAIHIGPIEFAQLNDDAVVWHETKQNGTTI